MIKTLNILKNQPHKYYCIVSSKGSQDLIKLPHIISPNNSLFITESLRIFSSEKHANQACKKNEKPLYLICLSCFLNILRSRIGISKMLLNEEYQCDVASWRTPCQTTAILKNNNDAYYIEGCRESGVFWKSMKDKPESPPAFLQCGATSMDCIWDGCPNGWEFFDTDPITLCKVSTKASIENPKSQYIINFEAQNTNFFYAGISEEGFDFAKTRDFASHLNYKLAYRIAKAIANVQLNWSRGMMSGKPGCRIVVSDIKGQELIIIEP